MRRKKTDFGWNCLFGQVPAVCVHQVVGSKKKLFMPLTFSDFIGRSSHRRCFVRKDVLRNIAKVTGKHLCQSLFFNKVAG